MLFRRTIVGLAGILTLCFFPSCNSGGSGKSDGGSGGPTAKEALTSLVEVLNHFQETKKSMPNRLADISPVEPLFPGAYLGLSNGSIVYVWGVPIDKSAPSTVLAYEKK